MAELTYKQRLFVTNYLGEANGNATEAARMAGYRHPNVAGARLLAKVSIRARIEARLDEAALTADEILARLSEHATGSFEPFLKIGEDGSITLDLKRAKKLGKLCLVKKLKQGDQGIEIQLYDAQKALIQLGKYRRLFVDRVEATGDSAAQAMADALNAIAHDEEPDDSHGTTGPDETGDAPEGG